MDTIYLDHNASTPLMPEVIAAMRPWLEDQTGNPSSSHIHGLRCRDALATAREDLARLLGVDAAEITFTGGGTEANNIVIQGLARKAGQGHMICSTVEHPAVLEPMTALQEQGFSVTQIPVDGDALLSAEDVSRALRPDTVLVSVMLANNETGTVQPLRQIVDLVRAYREEHPECHALVHTDAAQAVGKYAFDVSGLGVDFLSVAGHKFNAPKGVGALWMRAGLSLPPLMLGGGHERGLRPGTENILELVGLGAAARVMHERGDALRAGYAELRNQLVSQLQEGIPDLVVHADSVTRLENTANLRFPGVRAGDLLSVALEISASAGAACHADSSTPSHVLTAMGLDATAASECLRLSVGWGNTPAQIELAARSIINAVQQLR